MASPILGPTVGTSCQNIFTMQQQPFNIVGKKRKMDDCFMDTETKENRSTPKMSRRKFLSIPCHSCVFQSEVVDNRGSMLYHPILEDLLINTRSHEQVSFAQGNYFIADEQGSYSSTQQGDVVNLWRFCVQERKLYIARSLLFLDKSMYMSVRRQLEEL